MDRLRGPTFDVFLDYLATNLEVARVNLEHFEGSDLLRTQGDARTLRAILNTANRETGSPGRPGQGRAR